MHQIGLLNDRKQLEAAESTVVNFFKELGRGRMIAAKAKVTDDFVWFGTAVRKEDWSKKSLAKFMEEAKLKVGAVRVIPQNDLAAMPQYALAQAFGPLVEGDQVFLIDLTRGETTATTAVVVSCKDAPVLRRAVDPGEFVSFVRVAGAVSKFS